MQKATRQANRSAGEVEVDNGIIYHKTEYRERRNHVAYFACSHPLAGFDTQREAFLGPYRGLHEPLVVERGSSTDSIAHGWAPVGSHHIKVSLAPGAEEQVVFLLGYHENPDTQKFDPPDSSTVNTQAIRPLIETYTRPEKVDASFAALITNWDDLLERFQVETPDEHTNSMVNVWNAYQNMVTFNMSRSASFFESGVGRGMGFRDSTAYHIDLITA